MDRRIRRAASQALGATSAPPAAPWACAVGTAYTSALTYAVEADPLVGHDVPAPAEINAVIVGAGSIDGAITYALARTPDLHGQLDIVDTTCCASTTRTARSLPVRN